MLTQKGKKLFLIDSHNLTRCWRLTKQIKAILAALFVLRGKRGKRGGEEGVGFHCLNSGAYRRE